MVKPINLASLKFSGRFLVLMAYRVHITIRNASNPRGTIIPIVVTLHVNLTFCFEGKSNVESAGSRISMTVIMAHSTPISIHVMTTCADALMKRGFLVIIFFLLPASIRAIRLVLVTNAP